ncbi:MAG TPA: NHLP leader peptide family RiPP precursor [Elusimicrobiota bacterium]|nr:NHLP leader peptide family RiPP precursor [Elusimicrobiota bacterium]
MAEIKNAKESQDKIIKKALTDPAFKKALLADANAAIEKELGAKLPAGIKVKVVEDSANTVHLVLPAVPGKGELSEAELGQVSGGFNIPDCGNKMTIPAGATKPGYCVANTNSKC